MSDNVWRAEIARAAQRDLRRLDPQIRRRVLTAIKGMIADPPQGDNTPFGARAQPRRSTVSEG